MKFRDIFGAEEAGIRRYSNDDKPKRAEIAPFERVRITLVTLFPRIFRQLSRLAQAVKVTLAQDLVYRDGDGI